MWQGHLSSGLVWGLVWRIMEYQVWEGPQGSSGLTFLGKARPRLVVPFDVLKCFSSFYQSLLWFFNSFSAWHANAPSSSSCSHVRWMQSAFSQQNHPKALKPERHRIAKERLHTQPQLLIQPGPASGAAAEVWMRHEHRPCLSSSCSTQLLPHPCQSGITHLRVQEAGQGCRRAGALLAAIAALRNSRVSLIQDKLLTHLFSSSWFQSKCICWEFTGFQASLWAPLPYSLIPLKCSLQHFSMVNAIPKAPKSPDTWWGYDVNEDELKPSLTALADRAPRKKGDLSPALLRAQKKAGGNSKAINWEQ